MKLMKLFPLRNWQFYVFHRNNNSIISIVQRKSLSNKYRELFLVKSLGQALWLWGNIVTWGRKCLERKTEEVFWTWMKIKFTLFSSTFIWILTFSYYSVIITELKASPKLVAKLRNSSCCREKDITFTSIAVNLFDISNLFENTSQLECDWSAISSFCIY